MTLRKLWMTSLVLCLTVVAAEAKKQAKFEPATPLTAEQSALVQKAIAREKVTIKAIQKRTPRNSMGCLRYCMPNTSRRPS